MYTRFFGLTEKPFAITPDPRYLFLSERHAEALAHLAYGIKEAGGFIQLTGEVGTGKTTVVRSLLQQLPAECDIALILNPNVTPAEFLTAIFDELHIAVPDRARGSVKELVDGLNRYLLDAHARGRRVVVMVDEAQNLSPETLEQVRLLTNLETATQKLLQIILIGQPELKEVLGRNELRQLAQRITGRYHLEALSSDETAAYVRHRLRVAGATSEIFTPRALAEVHRLSKGIPRVINVLCDRALLGAFALEEPRITPTLLRRAAAEVYGRPVLPFWARAGAMLGATAGAAVIGIALWSAWPRSPADVPAVARAAPASTPASSPASITPTVVEEVPRAPVTRSLADVLALHAGDAGTDGAFARLFQLWGIQYRPDAGRPCEQALAQGLECVAQQGSFAQLKLVNRPAIVALVDRAGNERQVVVSALDGEQVVLALGPDGERVALPELAQQWFGEFLVLWRPPVAGARIIRPGMQGEEVRWLRRGLEQLSGLPPQTARDDVFDDSLVALVEDFQRTHRLSVDGVAGVQTQIVLDGALGSQAGPALSRVASAGG